MKGGLEEFEVFVVGMRRVREREVEAGRLGEGLWVGMDVEGKLRGGWDN